MFSNRSTGARREFHNQTKPSHLFRGDSTWAEPVNWAHEPYKLGQKFRLVETRRPSDPSFSNPFHASHAALARETRPPPRFVDLPRTGQSPREGKKIRSTSGATSEITITRPLLHKTRPFPSLARFSNRRNSTSCPSFLILENTPALLLLYSRGMHVDPPVKTPFTVISFFFLFFFFAWCFGEKPDFSHYASAILHSASSVQSEEFRRWGKIVVYHTRGRFDEIVLRNISRYFLLFYYSES